MPRSTAKKKELGPEDAKSGLGGTLRGDSEVSRLSIPGFPGGAVVENPPANAGVHGFESWSGKIPHAAEQLSPCATTTEPAL